MEPTDDLLLSEAAAALTAAPRGAAQPAPAETTFLREWAAFKTLASKTQERFSLREEDLFPFLDDKTATTDFDRHYVYHTAWAARVLAQTRPTYHVDISSSLYFSAIVSAFVPVQFYDIRPAELVLDNLESRAGDLMALPFGDNAVASLSCMHTVEHVGLGRYGDPLDYDGDVKAIAELKRVLAPGGNLLFVVPVGQPRVMFNAHRIYSYHQVRQYFAELELVNFALIPDSARDGGLVDNAPPALADAQLYACGCFWFRKKSA
jgi:SAM-dependent methyltransferase